MTKVIIQGSSKNDRVRMNFNIPKDLRERFKEKCGRIKPLKKSYKEVLVNYIYDVIRGKVKIK